MTACECISDMLSHLTDYTPVSGHACPWSLLQTAVSNQIYCKHTSN